MKFIFLRVKGNTMILKAEEKHLNIVREITQQTINEIYPHYYPIKKMMDKSMDKRHASACGGKILM